MILVVYSSHFANSYVECEFREIQDIGRSRQLGVTFDEELWSAGACSIKATNSGGVNVALQLYREFWLTSPFVILDSLYIHHRCGAAVLTLKSPPLQTSTCWHAYMARDLRHVAGCLHPNHARRIPSCQL